MYFVHANTLLQPTEAHYFFTLRGRNWGREKNTLDMEPGCSVASACNVAIYFTPMLSIVLVEMPPTKPSSVLGPGSLRYIRHRTAPEGQLGRDLWDMCLEIQHLPLIHRV